MSQFLGAALPTQRLEESDDRHGSEFYFNDEDFLSPRLLPQAWENFQEFAGYASPWWPNRSGFITDGVDMGMGLDPEAKWGDYWTRSGANGRLGFVGYSRDAYGTPMPGCLVKLFRVVDDSLQASVTSDATGLYYVTTPYLDAHYIVMFNPAATPPVAGASLNTLIPG